MPQYRITDPATGRTWIANQKPTPEEVDELLGHNLKPLSHGDPADQIQNTSLFRRAAATATRVGGGIVGASVGSLFDPLVGPAGTMVGGALGAGAGEVLAEELEGRELRPKEIGAQTVLGGVAPLASTALRGAAYGLGSVTLDSISRDQGLPSVGQAALGIVFGGAAGHVVDRLTMRTSLKEILPNDVANAAHELMTTGRMPSGRKLFETFPPRMAATPARGTFEGELAEFRNVQRQLRFPFTPKEVPPSFSLEDISAAEPRYEPRESVKGAKGRFESRPKKLTSEYQQQPLPGLEREQKYTVDVYDWWGGSPPKGPRTEYDFPEPPEQPPGPLSHGRVHPMTALLAPIARPGRLADSIERQTGLKAYSEILSPLHDAVASGSRADLENVAKDIEKKFGVGRFGPFNVKLSNDPDTDAWLRNYVETTVRQARGVADGHMRDLEYAINSFAKRFPLVGRELSQETRSKLAYTLLSLPQLGILPGRGPVALRVFSHTVQTGYHMLGERWLARGIIDGLTPAGIREARELGILEAEHLSDEVKAMAGKPGMVEKLIRYGYWGFKKAQDLSRSIMFHGQRARTLWAAKHARTVEEFVDMANLDYAMPEQEALRIAKLYSDGDVRAAAQMAGKVRADYGIPGHGKLDRPEIMQTSTLGRGAFGLFNWPNFYGSMIKNSFMNPRTPFHKRALGAARWAAANYFLLQVASSLYTASRTRSAYQKARELTFFGPVFYEGGPLISAAQQTIQGTKMAVSGEKGGVRRAARGALPFIPFSGAAQDIFGSGGYMEQLGLIKTDQDRNAR